MEIEDKINAIVDFIKKHPETVASRTILRRNLKSFDQYETAQELSFELENILKNQDSEKVDFFYYLIK